MSKTKVQRSISVPAEIDDLALKMCDEDPDCTYSIAIRKILRAGIQVIEEREHAESERSGIKVKQAN